MTSRRLSGGGKDFVDDGKPLDDTGPTKAFKEGMKKHYKEKEKKKLDKEKREAEKSRKAEIRITEINAKTVKRNRLLKKVKFFLRFIGLGLVVVSLIYKDMPKSKIATGIGLLFLAVSFMIKKK